MNEEMMDEELKELFRGLEEQGWDPQLCDTPVPLFDNPVKCGNPTEIGDVVGEEVMMPRKWTTLNSTFMATVEGQSMKDADILEGDKVKVETAHTYHDGDILLLSIDGAYTLKAYCVDEEGTPWLVPQNPTFRAFPLHERQNVVVHGVVKEVIKLTPRISYRSCIKIINDVKMDMMKEREITPDRVTTAIRRIADEIEVARYWYAVYRVLVDKGVVMLNDFDTFCTMVKDAVPDHEHLPTSDEMQRLAVDSFAKPVSRWKPSDAPVKGKRFKDYLKLAQRMTELLDE